MSDEMDDRDLRDGSPAPVRELHEIPYWTEKFGVSAEVLKEAIAQVGTSTAALRRYLKDTTGEPDEGEGA